MERNCWCGNTDLTPFSSDYAECRVCGTLVSQNSLSDDQLTVKDDETDFYGKQYWLTHQNQDLGFPNIYARARNDLTERNLHWLRTLLKYRFPPANVLELGCSHGSFVALLQQCGYQASGVEMSPWVVSFGRNTFKAPIQVGPVEDLNLPKESFDVIALMDVLEHLPDPLSTIGQCISLLKPNGLLLIQTPDFQEGSTYQTLIETKNPFLEQLKFDEHLYLFSQKSICNFLQKLQYSHVQFEPAIFADYDMFLIASKVPLSTYTDEQWASQLMQSPQGRITLALLDTRERELKLAQRISDLTQQLTECYQDLEDKVRQITNLSDWLKQTQVWLEEAKASNPKD
jgi:2-polyprenyl-3-methyl-5-hydroxy-6-metoxy-1,4-benzoquinol methylase